jgi:hypothetical protein
MIVNKSYRKKLPCLLSVVGQTTKAVLAQISMAVFFTHSVSDIIFANFFLSKQLAYRLSNRGGPQFE